MQTNAYQARTVELLERQNELLEAILAKMDNPPIPPAEAPAVEVHAGARPPALPTPKPSRKER